MSDLPNLNGENEMSENFQNFSLWHFVCGIQSGYLLFTTNDLLFFQGTKCKYYPDPDFKLEWNGGIGKRGMIFRPGTSKCEAPEN